MSKITDLHIYSGVIEPQNKDLWWLVGGADNPLSKLKRYTPFGWSDVFLGSSGGGGIEDAPFDGNQYLRGSGNWHRFNFANYVTVGQLQSELNNNLTLSGGIMTGPLVLNSDPTTQFEAATKGYVDAVAENTFHTFDSTYFTDVNDYVSLRNSSIDDSKINYITTSKIAGLDHFMSTTSNGLSLAATRAELTDEVGNRIYGDNVLQNNIDLKQNRVLAGTGIELTQNSNGTTTISAVSDLYIIVQILPAVGDPNRIYMVPDGSGGYFQYIYEGGSWYPLGSSGGATVDLSNYYNKQNVDSLLSNKANITDVYTQAQTNTLLNNKTNQTDFNTLVSAVNAKANQASLNAHTSDTNNPHGTTPAKIGLGNVDNTSDVNKPISTAVNTALNTKADDTSVVHNVGNESIAGKKTFSVVPGSSQAPFADTDLVNKDYVDTTKQAKLVAGTNITIDNTDPAAPIINSTGGGAGPVSPYAIRRYDITSLFEVTTSTGNPPGYFRAYIDAAGDIEDSQVTCYFLRNEVETVSVTVTIKVPLGFGSSQAVTYLGEGWSVSEEIGSQNSIVTLNSTTTYTAIRFFWKTNDEGANQTEESFYVTTNGVYTKFNASTSPLEVNAGTGAVFVFDGKSRAKQDYIGINFGKDFEVVTSIPDNFIYDGSNLRRIGLMYFGNVTSVGSICRNCGLLQAISFRSLKNVGTNFRYAGGLTNCYSLAQIDFAHLSYSILNSAFANAGRDVVGNKYRYHTTQDLADTYNGETSLSSFETVLLP
jgi:hypothetical protein